MNDGTPRPDFWRGRRVFLTGHTGFKGAWLALWLERLGAEVHAYALPPATTPSLFEAAAIGGRLRSTLGDVRDAAALAGALAASRAEVVLHLAAQALVRVAYEAPVETFATNVLGTVHLLEAVRAAPSVRAVVVVTTDKVYENRGARRAFVESDPLGGHDPYSASKAATEIAVASYRDSFLSAGGGRPTIAVATARAGNVVGGGDWSRDRLVPDVVAALAAGRPVELRRPEAVRPWQHVLDPLAGYLRLAERLGTDGEAFAEAWNFAPSEDGEIPVGELVERLHRAWGRPFEWAPQPGEHPHEAEHLALDAGMARERLGWRPRLDLDRAIAWIADWHRRAAGGEDAADLCGEQIAAWERLG